MSMTAARISRCLFITLLLPLFAGCVEPESPVAIADEIDTNHLFSRTWPLSVKSIDELKTQDAANPKWYEYEFNGTRLVVAVEVQPSFGESFIDICGYCFDRNLNEWRRFVVANTCHAGKVDVILDRQAGQIVVLGAANNDLKGKPLVTVNLAVVVRG